MHLNFLKQFPSPIFWILNLVCLNSELLSALFGLIRSSYLLTLPIILPHLNYLAYYCYLRDRWCNVYQMDGWTNGWMNKWMRKWENGHKPMQNNLPQPFSLKKFLIHRVGSSPYHKCLIGRGVCFMATRAPPQSRNQTLYSSSKIWNNNNNNHSKILHLHSAWLFTKSFTHIVLLDSEPSNNPIRQFGKYYHPHLIDEEMGLQTTNNSP